MVNADGASVKVHLPHMVDDLLQSLFFAPAFAQSFQIAVVACTADDTHPQSAYDYFCMEMENILYYRFGLKSTLLDIGVTSSLEKEMLRSAIIAVSHQIYLNACFRLLSK